MLLDPQTVGEQVLQRSLHLGVGLQGVIGPCAQFLGQHDQHVAQVLHAFAAFLQARFEGVGTVEQGADRVLAATVAAVAQPKSQ